MSFNPFMTEGLELDKTDESIASDVRIPRLAKFLVCLAAYQSNYRDDVEVPVEGTSQTVYCVPETQDAREWDRQARGNLKVLCGDNEELALDIIDKFLCQFLDERDLWPSDDYKNS